MYHVVSFREQIDAQVAKQLAEKMEREELERQALEEGDQEIARKLQVITILTLFSFVLQSLLHIETHLTWRRIFTVCSF